MVVDLIGTFVFAVAGATAAIQSDLDFFGVMVLSFATALGGGIIRDLLIGASCVLAAGAGYVVTPHRRMSLLGAKTYAGLAPFDFGDWTSRDAGDLAPAVEQGSLASRLYDEQVQRERDDKQDALPPRPPARRRVGGACVGHIWSSSSTLRLSRLASTRQSEA